jgi:hypothetical protein
VGKDVAEQRFGPTSGLFTGWGGVVMSAAVGVVVAVQDPTPTGLGVAALVLAMGVLAWCFLVRPRVLVRDDDVVLRNAFVDWHIPLQAVQDVVVRQTTVVATDNGLYRGIGVGRPLRRMIKDAHGSRPGPERLTAAPGVATADVPDAMVEHVLARSEHARAASAEPRQPHREYAVPELVALAVLLLAFVVLALL